MDAELTFDVDLDDVAATFADFVEALVPHLEAAAVDIGLRVQRAAMRLVNVDTGRLRASIDHEVQSAAEDVVSVAVGTNVEYAIWQEIDNPYLRPAFEAEREYIRQRIAEAQEAAWEDVT